MAGRLLREEAEERSTYTVRVSFLDENEQPASPNDLTWSLYRSGRRIVNSRSQVVVTPASTVAIVLTDDDLALFANDSPIRILLVEGTYDSDAGVNLPIRDSVRFKIRETEE